MLPAKQKLAHAQNITLSPCQAARLKKVKGKEDAAKPEPTHFMAYVINDKIGVGILPVDGNPHKTCAIIAHPHGVSFQSFLVQLIVELIMERVQ